MCPHNTHIASGHHYGDFQCFLKVPFRFCLKIISKSFFHDFFFQWKLRFKAEVTESHSFSPQMKCPISLYMNFKSIFSFYIDVWQDWNFSIFQWRLHFFTSLFEGEIKLSNDLAGLTRSNCLEKIWYLPRLTLFFLLLIVNVV